MGRFELALIFIAIRLTFGTNFDTKSSSKFVHNFDETGVIRSVLDVESFEHFDCIFFWRSTEKEANLMSLASQNFSVKFQKSTISQFNLVNPFLSLSFGFSAVFAILSDLNGTKAFLELTANLYTTNKMSKKFWSPYFFIFLPSSSSSVLTPANLQNFAGQFNIASEVYIILLNEEFEIKSIHEFYHIKKVRVAQDITTDLTVRDSEGRSLLSFWKVVQKTGRRSNFHQEVIIGVNVDSPEYPQETKFKYDGNNKTEFESGFNVLEYWYLRDAMNFSEAALTWPNYLKPGPNGTLIGLAIPVNTELADIGIGATEFLEYRISGPDGITYLHPIFYNEILAFFRQPVASSIRDIFFLTFSTEVWAVLMGTWCLIVTSLVTAVHLKRRTDRHSVHSLDTQLSRDSLLFAVSAICQQGWHTSPHSPSIRMIFLIGIFTALISYIAYSASLVSILSVEVIPVRSFRDLLDHKFNIFSDRDIPTSKAVVSSLEDQGVIKKLEDPDARMVNVSESIPRLIKSKIAIVSMADSFFQVLDSRGYDAEFTCSHLSKVTLSPVPVVSSMFIKRNSPLRKYFNVKILLMKERGIMDHLRNHYIRHSSVQCLKKGGSGFHQQLGGKDLFSAYVILGFGVTMAGIIGIIERILYLKLN